MAERAQIEQHRHASPGLTGMDQSSVHEGISKPMGAVRRVRDDVLRKGSIRFEEVLSPCPVASVDQVRGHHLVSCCLEHLGNGSIAAGRFPYRALEALHRQECPNGFRWGWVKLEGSTLWKEETSVRNI